MGHSININDVDIDVVPETKKRKRGRPMGSKSKIQIGTIIRQHLEKHDVDIDQIYIDFIIKHQNDWAVLKDLLPYVYSKMPQETHIKTNDSIPLLVITGKEDEDKEE